MINSITITISDLRAIDGWVEAANRAGMTPEAMALELLQGQGLRYADLFKIGVLTSAAFVQRFTAAEYGAIRAAAEQSAEVASLIGELVNSQLVLLTDDRIAPALAKFTVDGLLAEGRPVEIQAWERPIPQAPEPEAVDAPEEPSTEPTPGPEPAAEPAPEEEPALGEV